MSNTYPEDGALQRPDATPESGGAAGVKEKLGEVKQSVRQEASQFASDAQARTREKVAEKQQALGGALQDFAEAVRGASDKLGERDQTQVSQLVRQAADGLESLARNIAEKSPGEMLDQARRLGRSNPTALLIGSVVAGVALGRFLRSTAEPATNDAFGDEGYGYAASELDADMAPVLPAGGLEDEFAAGDVDASALSSEGEDDLDASSYGDLGTRSDADLGVDLEADSSESEDDIEESDRGLPGTVPGREI